MPYGRYDNSDQPEGTRPHADPAGFRFPARTAGAPLTPSKAMTPPPPDIRPAVKPPLTSRRRPRVVENDEYAAFARRVLRAWARRVAAGDIDAIADMAAAARQLDEATRQAVSGLRGKGYSWAEIAARLGVTRQAAQQRWGGNQAPSEHDRSTRPGAPPMVSEAVSARLAERAAQRVAAGTNSTIESAI